MLFVIDTPLRSHIQTEVRRIQTNFYFVGKELCLGLIVALILSARSLDAQVPNFYHGPAPAYLPLVRATFRALVSGPAFFFNPQADGGGDGGSGDGGSGDGSSSDGSSSTDGSSSNDGADAAAAAAAVAAAVAQAPSASDPTAQDIAATENNTQESPLDAIQAIATTDPRGGEEVSPGSTIGGVVNGPSGVVGGPGGSIPPAGGSPPRAAPVDVAINAVIVSGANSPWGAVQRAPGVRNVTVTGGIIALGKTPLPGEPPPGSPQPAWLRVIPDLRLLDGSVIPPVVPNIIDIRWLNCPIEVIENPGS
jgi:hypothetical protein